MTGGTDSEGVSRMERALRSMERAVPSLAEMVPFESALQNAPARDEPVCAHLSYTDFLRSPGTWLKGNDRVYEAILTQATVDRSLISGTKGFLCMINTQPLLISDDLLMKKKLIVISAVI